MAFLNEHADVVADDLAQDFVDHRDRSLAVHGIAELGLDHGEVGLDIAALVILRKEVLAPQLEVQEHLLPETAARANRDKVRSVRCLLEG